MPPPMIHRRRVTDTWQWRILRMIERLAMAAIGAGLFNWLAR